MKYVTHKIIQDILLMSYILDTYIFLFLSIQNEFQLTQLLRLLNNCILIRYINL